MRFKSKTKNGFTVYAVSGTDTVSFAIDFNRNKAAGLLGFAVERQDLTENERYFMRGFKVFEVLVPKPDSDMVVSTFEHPVQSFVWDDFTAKPEHEYIYYFYPLKGTPKSLDRSLKAIEIKVKTEILFAPDAEHHVFFNRGVASSQAYKIRFDNKAPDQLEGAKKQEAYDWLSRNLDNALYAFIDKAQAGDQLLGCFYEFHYSPVLKAFKAALDRGVDVQVVIDAKANAQDFPRKKNLETLTEVGFPLDRIHQRSANPSYIQHNKFAVWMKAGVPQEVWTGSTNISEGGIFGHTNVGHWIVNKSIAEKYRGYWELLKNNGMGGAFKTAVVALSGDLDIGMVKALPNGTVSIFSPRNKKTMLNTYVDLIDQMEQLGCITLAFGVSKVFKDKLQYHTPQSPILFMLLEKPDVANKKKPAAFIKLDWHQNIYQSVGSAIKDGLNRWVKETNQKMMGLNNHVVYIHSKFLLHDPLGDAPIVVTGSANFSEPSTVSNDENMVIIKGDMRVADIYFTEFNRLFNHYYFRLVYNKSLEQNRQSTEQSLFLKEDDSWLEKYKVGSLRYKRIKLYKEMKGF
ncbi:MAG: phospholipase D-like domain-containing protein [Saprospiraceae bacterium]